MKERVVEILVYLMSEIEANKRLSEIDVDGLKQRGYTQSEISIALSWLYENIPMQDGYVVHQGKASHGSRRLLHDAERMMMTTEAQGYLMQLNELGLLDNREMETIIERAMVSGFEQFTIYEMREIVAAVLFSKKNGGHDRHVQPNDTDTIH